MTENYREALIESVNGLIQARHKLFGDALGLAMSGDLAEINDAFEIGDKYTFELSHLKDSADANLNKLVVLIEEIQTTVDTLIEENEIEEDEIQWEDDQP